MVAEQPCGGMQSPRPPVMVRVRVLPEKLHLNLSFMGFPPHPVFKRREKRRYIFDDVQDVSRKLSSPGPCFG